MDTESPPESAIEDEFDTDRQLCPDDACIGVLNTEGVCNECGASGENASAENASADSPVSSDTASGVDLLHRSLCPDGECIGLLGPDGRCKECGRVGEQVLSDPRLRGLKSENKEDKKDSAPTPVSASSSSADDQSTEDPAPDTNDSFSDRRLCPDGCCIGVIGSAGTCNECGTVA
jgi:hypothetical protein